MNWFKARFRKVKIFPIEERTTSPIEERTISPIEECTISPIEERTISPDVCSGQSTMTSPLTIYDEFEAFELTNVELLKNILGDIVSDKLRMHYASSKLDTLVIQEQIALPDKSSHQLSNFYPVLSRLSFYDILNKLFKISELCFEIASDAQPYNNLIHLNTYVLMMIYFEYYCELVYQGTITYEEVNQVLIGSFMFANAQLNDMQYDIPDALCELFLEKDIQIAVRDILKIKQTFEMFMFEQTQFKLIVPREHFDLYKKNCLSYSLGSTSPTTEVLSIFTSRTPSPVCLGMNNSTQYMLERMQSSPFAAIQEGEEWVSEESFSKESIQDDDVLLDWVPTMPENIENTNLYGYAPIGKSNP